MSNEPKKPARTKKAAKASELLDELNSVSDMLGDAADDVPAAPLSEDDVPLLANDDEADSGDSQNQIPLLGADGNAAAKPDSAPPSTRLETLARERENPFLPRSKLDELAQSQSQTDKSLRELNPDRPRPPSAPAPSAPATPDVESIIDDLVAEWLPRLERELRDRLARALRNKP